MYIPPGDALPRFDMDRFAVSRLPGRIGGGAIGAKSSGLLEVERVLGSVPPAVAGIEVFVPPWVVLGAEVFEQFLRRNSLGKIAASVQSDEHIAAAFQEADLPYEAVVDLWSLVETLREPLAVRPSLVAEPEGHPPEERILATKITPNHQPDRDERLRRLMEAIKFVYASPFFRAGKGTSGRSGSDPAGSALAVIVQSVVGARHGNRYYPDLSGRYESRPIPTRGGQWSESGVVELVLGLGKTIVDGECRYRYPLESPWSITGSLDAAEVPGRMQREFWAVNVGQNCAYDPIAENEFLVKARLQVAEYDGPLEHAASANAFHTGCTVRGVGTTGPWAVTSVPLQLLQHSPVNEMLRHLVRLFRADLGERIELEFAVQMASAENPRLVRLGILLLQRG